MRVEKEPKMIVSSRRGCHRVPLIYIFCILPARQTSRPPTQWMLAVTSRLLGDNPRRGSHNVGHCHHACNSLMEDFEACQPSLGKSISFKSIIMQSIYGTS